MKRVSGPLIGSLFFVFRCPYDCVNHGARCSPESAGRRYRGNTQRRGAWSCEVRCGVGAAEIGPPTNLPKRRKHGPHICQDQVRNLADATSVFAYCNLVRTALTSPAPTRNLFQTAWPSGSRRSAVRRGPWCATDTGLRSYARHRPPARLPRVGSAPAR